MTRVTKKLRDMDWLTALGKARREAVAKWQLLIGMCPMAFAVGRQLSADSLRKATDEEMQASINDSLATRASKTLVLRAGSMFRYVAYCRIVGRAPFPMSEALAYSYVSNLAETKAKPTVAKAFCSAVAFCHHVLALQGASAVIESRRVGGSAHKQYEAKSPLKQAKTLTVSMVDALEHGIFFMNNAKDRVACGFFLYCFYARARFNDAQSVESLELDETVVDDHGGKRGYLEGLTRRVKTSSTLERKTRFLPMAAASVGIRGTNWADEWMKLRERVGLSDKPEGALLPASGPGMSWQKRALTSREGSELLRELLLLCGFSACDVEGLSTHSLKSTPLSWCAKAGLIIDIRRFLGYHIQTGDKSLLTYSRDAAAAPLRAFDAVIDLVSSKRFMPDKTRSGYLVSGASLSGAGALSIPEPPSKRPKIEEAEGEFTHIEELDVQDVECLTDSSSSDDEDQDPVDSVGEGEVSVVAGSSGPHLAPSTRMSDVFYKHKVSRCLHCRDAHDFTRLACGRAVHSSYVLLDEVPRFFYPRCTQCFGEDDLEEDGPEALPFDDDVIE